MKKLIVLVVPCLLFFSCDLDIDMEKYGVQTVTNTSGKEVTYTLDGVDYTLPSSSPNNSHEYKFKYGYVKKITAYKTDEAVLKVRLTRENYPDSKFELIEPISLKVTNNRGVALTITDAGNYLDSAPLPVPTAGVDNGTIYTQFPRFSLTGTNAEYPVKFTTWWTAEVTGSNTGGTLYVIIDAR